MKKKIKKYTSPNVRSVKVKIPCIGRIFQNQPTKSARSNEWVLFNPASQTGKLMRHRSLTKNVEVKWQLEHSPLAPSSVFPCCSLKMGKAGQGIRTNCNDLKQNPELCLFAVPHSALLSWGTGILPSKGERRSAFSKAPYDRNAREHLGHAVLYQTGHLTVYQEFSMVLERRGNTYAEGETGTERFLSYGRWAYGKVPNMKLSNTVSHAPELFKI